ncbi:MAG: O-antigen ligase [Bacteroidetes bacterium]|nr:O-antigen ligase [Bacteroidota bacterium]
MTSPIQDFWNSIFVNLVGIFAIIVVVFVNIRFSKFSILNIVYTFSIFWGFLILGTQWILNYKLEMNFLLLMYSIPVLFNVVFLFIRLFLINNQSNEKEPLELFYKDRIWYVVLALFLLCLIANGIYVYNQYYLKGIELVALEQIRTSKFRLDTDEPNLFFNLFGRIYLLLLPWFYYLYGQQKLNKGSLVVVVIISLLLSAVFLTRAPILILCIYIMLCNSYFMDQKLAKKWNISLVISAALILVGISSIIEGSFNEANGFLYNFKVYLFGGVGAFQNLVKGYHLVDPFAANYFSTFDFVYYIEKKIGVINSYPSYIRDYIDFGGHTTNVYTFLDSYFIDWGIIGVVLGSAVLFAITSIVFLLSTASKKIVFFQIYLLFFSNIMMCFMNNEFIRISFFIMLFQIILLWLLFLKKQQTISTELK